MLFNSFTFVGFLLVVFATYWALGRLQWGRQAQNILLLAGSYLFYGWWDPRFLILIVLSSAVDYGMGLAMARQTDRRQRRPFLWVSLGVNLGALAFFKYANFFAASLADGLAGFGLQADFPTLNIILPVGISFYTFQTLSYSIDIYRGRLEPTRDPLDFFAFVAFFPQLVAGPIERASHLLPQFTRARQFDYYTAVSGLRLILWGFFKKLVIADRMGEYVDAVYKHPDEFSGTSLVIVNIMFALQIYCDFSGYSDIAIGTGRLFGFRLSPNFRTPYLALSIRNFWERWHISLTSWFRDYIYLPLGGNRVGAWRWAANILIVFLLSGLWHGAAYGFIVWGAIHGTAYLFEVKLRMEWRWESLHASWLRWTLTMGLVTFAWVFFRVPTYPEWALVLERMGQGGEMDLFFKVDSELSLFFSGAAQMIYVLALPIFLLLFEKAMGERPFDEFVRGWPRWSRWALYYGLAAAVLFFGTYGVPQRFIYFQF